MITKQIGVRIKELRAQTGLSQEAFANKIDMARTYFAEVETGKRNISVRNLAKIADGLEISLAEFFNSDYFAGEHPQASRPPAKNETPTRSSKA